MKTCIYPNCGLPISTESDQEDPYCTRECFDAHIADTAREFDRHEARLKALASVVIPTPVIKCSIMSEIKKLRVDAECRVKNIDSFGSDRLLKTKEYFQSRADVLNDLLMFAGNNEICSCCK